MNINEYNFSGKKALVRVDFNVPLDENYQIVDDTRMRASLPTIKKIIADGGSAIIMSHLGRPKAGAEYRFSLKHLIVHLGNLLGTNVLFADDCVGAEAQKMSENLKPGQALLLENTRFHGEETKGDEAFARRLSRLGDVYVNDAFGSAHRAHASTAIVANYFDGDSKMFGYLMNAEVANARKVMDDTQRPYTAILGGAKVSDKILIIENLLDKVDNLIIGGGMAYTFFKAQGGEIGNSLLEEDKVDTAKKVLAKAEQKGVKIYLPEDAKAADKFANDANTKFQPGNAISEGWIGLDIGPEAINTFEGVIANSKTILWNGPMGVFEMPTFQKGTENIAKAIAKATENGAFSLIGGGGFCSSNQPV